MNARCESALRGSRGRCSAVSSSPAVHLVVLVSRALREHRPEDIDVGHDIGRVVLEAGGHTSIEITSSRVEGAAQRPRIGVERIAES